MFGYNGEVTISLLGHKGHVASQSTRSHPFTRIILLIEHLGIRVGVIIKGG